MGDNVFKFHDGTRLQRVNEATYLGHRITQHMDVNREVHHKMQQTRITWNRLNMFWKADCCSIKRKLEVYDAIIGNKLLYGLETVRCTQRMQKKADAFQLGELRKLLQLSMTFVNRANTNACFINKANQEINANRPNLAQRRHIKLFSEMLIDKKGKVGGTCYQHKITPYDT